MSIPLATKNAALTGFPNVDALSLHTAWPGVTGANEVTGGSPAYGRQAVTLGAASGGQRTVSSAVTFDVPATTVRWLGMWAGSAFVGAMTNGGSSPKNFVAMPASSLIMAPAHGLASGAAVAFFNGTPPGGLSEGTVYYLRDVTTDSFRVAATSGGEAIGITSGSPFGCVVGAVTEKVYASQGTHQVTTITVAVPD